MTFLAADERRRRLSVELTQAHHGGNPLQIEGCLAAIEREHGAQARSDAQALLDALDKLEEYA